MRIIIDTNLWVAFAIGKRLRALGRLFERDDITIYVCDELFDEFRIVMQRPKFSKIVKVEDVVAVLALMRGRCSFANITHRASSPLRDAKDLYLLALAETVQADYILTGDRDLLDLRHHHHTLICSYADFTTLVGL